MMIPQRADVTTNELEFRSTVDPQIAMRIINVMNQRTLEEAKSSNWILRVPVACSMVLQHQF